MNNDIITIILKYFDSPLSLKQIALENAISISKASEIKKGIYRIRSIYSNILKYNSFESSLEITRTLLDIHKAELEYLEKKLADLEKEKQLIDKTTLYNTDNDYLKQIQLEEHQLKRDI